MWKLILLAVGVVMSGLAGLRAADEDVQVAAGVAGAWRMPAGAWDGRAVLLLHGFASERDEVGGLFKRTAEALAARGIASLRINFRGEGDSRRTDIRSTAQTRRADALAAAEFLATHAGVDVKRVGVLGFSLGCVTAVDAGAEKPDAFRSAVLWSSPSGNLRAGLATTFRPAFEQAMKSGEGSMELHGWKTVTLQREFFNGYADLVFERRLEKFPGALLLVRGSEDYLPARDAELLKIAAGRPAEVLMLGGADHIFKVLDPQASYAERIVEATAAWFERTL